MFTEQDVRQAFGDLVQDESLILEVVPEGVHVVEVSVFVDRFGDASSLTKEALAAHPNATPKWVEHFDRLFA